ncbi:MAG: carbon-nitrogen hydrolase family protein [Spongiibacteraceae bacterium]|nr:carbon-nitrogen hydrolase family protein [Spongiibacteraceae bacterium]
MTQPQNLTVAAIQLVSGRDLAANLVAAERLLAAAAAAGAQLAVLPETFALYDSRSQQALGAAEAGADAIVRPWLREQARRHGLWLVGGTVPLLEPGDMRPRAASLAVNDQGEEVGRYDKLHLFDASVADGHGRYRESDVFQPGQKVTVVPTPWGGLGLAVCYDLRFPELFQQLRLNGATMIAVPSAFTRHTGQAHWLPLLRARAIETQCLMIGANQGGIHSERRQTSGGSAIVDAWGTVLAETGFGARPVIATFDQQRQLSIREAMPVLAHRRFGLTPP